MSDVDLGNVFYSIVAKDLTKAGTEAAKGNFAAAGLAIGAAMTAAGVAGTALIDKNTQLSGSLAEISQETGISEDAIRGLTMDLSSATDSIAEVNETMAALGKYGVTTADGMNEAASAALALADATNSTGSDVANNVVPTLQAYGMTVDDLGAKSDALTTITRSTKYSLADVTSILSKASPEAQAAGLSFDDMALTVEALGQKGVSSKQALSQINQAITDFKTANPDVQMTFEDLSYAIGLSSDEMDNATSKMKGGSGSTQAYSKIVGEHAGFVAEMASMWEKATVNVGAALAPYQDVFNTLSVIGPVLTAVNGLLVLNNTLHITAAASTVAHTVATTAMSAAQGVATTAQWLLNAAMSANPIGLVILAVAGLVAGILLLDSQFHFIEPTIQAITAVFQGLWSIIMQVVDAAGQVVGAIASIPGVSATISAVGSLAGARASGGPTEGGKSYLVGENGPEIFTPSTSGNVTANDAIGGIGNIYLTGDITVREDADIPKVATALGKEFFVQINRRNRNRGTSS